MSLLMLLMFVVTVIQLTSSQSTVDVTRPDNDVCSSGQTDQVLSVLSQLMSAVSQLQRNVSRLQADVAEIKAASGRAGEPGTRKGERKRDAARKLSQFKMSHCILI